MKICGICKSSEVHEKQWIDINTGKIIGDCEEDTYWCENCQEHINSEKLTEVKISIPVPDEKLALKDGKMVIWDMNNTYDFSREIIVVKKGIYKRKDEEE